MKLKKILPFVLAIVFIAVAAIILFRSSSSFQPISAQDIANVEFTYLPDGDSFLIDENQVESLVDAYNASQPIRNDVGTTHPMYVKIIFTDGETMGISGGVGNFITANRDDRQFNLRSDALAQWFEEFE